MISFLQNSKENSDFTDRLAILSAMDYVYYTIDCISNVRGRAQTHDACSIIIDKAPGIVEYLKGRIPASTSIVGMTPTDVFVAFGS